MQLTSLALYEPLKKDGKGKKETWFELFNKKEEQEGVWFWNVFVKKNIYFGKRDQLLSWIGDTGLAWRSVNKNRIASQRKKQERRKVGWSWQKRDRREH